MYPTPRCELRTSACPRRHWSGAGGGAAPVVVIMDDTGIAANGDANSEGKGCCNTAAVVSDAAGNAANGANWGAAAKSGAPNDAGDDGSNRN